MKMNMKMVKVVYLQLCFSLSLISDMVTQIAFFANKVR